MEVTQDRAKGDIRHSLIEFSDENRNSPTSFRKILGKSFALFRRDTWLQADEELRR
jgi:hypothetical protein